MKAPPLFVSFSSQERLVASLESPPEWERDAIRKLAADGLPPATSISTLATLFGYSKKFIASMRKVTTRYYRTFRLGDPDTGRKIEAPSVALKVIQKWIGEHLAEQVDLPETAHGFVPGRSLLTAASEHCPAHWVASVDVRNFFPSTPSTRIGNALERVGYPGRAVETLVPLLTYGDRLPQGSPASPVVANLCFASLDQKIEALADEFDATYTRYADDLVFSGGQSDISLTRIERLQEECRELVEENSPYEMHPGKTSSSIRPERVCVHGLTVHGESPRLPKEQRNRIRMMRHMLAENRQTMDDETTRRFEGHVAFADSVERFASHESDVE